MSIIIFITSSSSKNTRLIIIAILYFTPLSFVFWRIILCNRGYIWMSYTISKFCLIYLFFVIYFIAATSLSIHVFMLNVFIHIKKNIIFLVLCISTIFTHISVAWLFICLIRFNFEHFNVRFHFFMLFFFVNNCFKFSMINFKIYQCLRY